MLEIAQIAAQGWAEANAAMFAADPGEFGKRVAQVYAACKQELSSPASPAPLSVLGGMQQATEPVSLPDLGLSGGQVQSSSAGAAS
jgi:hypothetical protein